MWIVLLLSGKQFINKLIILFAITNTQWKGVNLWNSLWTWSKRIIYDYRTNKQYMFYKRSNCVPHKVQHTHTHMHMHTPTHTARFTQRKKFDRKIHTKRVLESFALDEIIALDLLRRFSPLLQSLTHACPSTVRTHRNFHSLRWLSCACVSIQIEINTHQANKFETNKSNYVPATRSSFILKFIAITSENL